MQKLEKSDEIENSAHGQQQQIQIPASKQPLQIDQLSETDDMTKEERAKIQSLKAKNPGQGLYTPNWQTAKLEPFQKDFYVVHEKTEKRTPEEIAAWRTENAITVIGKNFFKISYKISRFF